jgi:hypothetical protein
MNATGESPATFIPTMGTRVTATARVPANDFFFNNMM